MAGTGPKPSALLRKWPARGPPRPSAGEGRAARPENLLQAQFIKRLSKAISVQLGRFDDLRNTPGGARNLVRANALAFKMRLTDWAKLKGHTCIFDPPTAFTLLGAPSA